MIRERFSQFIQKNKIEIILFVLALFIRIILLVVIIWWQGKIGDLDNYPENLFPVHGADSTEYFRLTENIIIHKQFSLSEHAPFLPESLRMPGYPLFVVLILFVFKNLFAVSIIQDIIAALTVVIFYKMAKLFFSERVSRISAALLLFEPNGLYLSNVILSETLFVFLLILSLYIFLKQKNKPSYLALFLAGLILGLATLTRPVAQFLPIFFIGFILYSYRNVGFKKIISLSLLFLIVFSLVIFPWSLRNKILFNSWQLSSVGLFNFYHYDSAMFYAQKHNLSDSEGMAIFRSKLNATNIPLYQYWSLKNSKEFKRVIKEVILDDPVGFTYFYSIRTIPFFLNDGLRELFRHVRLLNQTSSNLSIFLFTGDLKGFFKFLSTGDLDSCLFLIGFLFWSLVMIFMVIAILSAILKRDSQSIYILFFFLLISFFAMATGPATNPRYRVPAAPLMFLLAAVGFEIFWGKMKILLREKKIIVNN